MSESTEKSQRLKSCGLTVHKILTKHQDVFSSQSSVSSFPTWGKPNWAKPGPTRLVSWWVCFVCLCQSVCLCVCIAVCVICCAAAPAGPGIRWTVSGIASSHRWRVKPPAATPASEDPEDRQQWRHRVSNMWAPGNVVAELTGANSLAMSFVCTGQNRTTVLTLWWTCETAGRWLMEGGWRHNMSQHMKQCWNS